MATTVRQGGRGAITRLASPWPSARWRKNDFHHHRNEHVAFSVISGPVASAFESGPIVLFGGVLIWAFGRKRTARREELEKPVTHHSRLVS